MRLIVALGGFALGCVAFACSDSDGGGGLARIGTEAIDSGLPDAAPVDAAPDVFDAGPITRTIAIHVTSPMWAARLDDTGAWVAYGPTASDAGTSYDITTTAATFSVAFACANADRSLVNVLTRPSNIGELDVTLPDYCRPPRTNVTELKGTFTGLEPNTGWLDFGDALDQRGAGFFTQNGSGDFDIVNTPVGTFDLAFGFRDDSVSPLTKIALARNVALAGNTTTFNLDLGPNGIAPGSATLTLLGLAQEQTHVSLQFTMNDADTGLELNNQNDPVGVFDAMQNYPTIDAAKTLATDRYRLYAHTIQDLTSERAVKTSFAAAKDLSFTLPAAADAPTASFSGKYVSTKVKTRANADVYEAYVFTKVTNQQSVEWSVSTSASLATGTDVDLTPPDLAAVAGFDATWLTPSLASEVTGFVHEVSDPGVDRYAGKTIDLTP